ncbi:MAG TPA: hypothetical protein VNM41_07480 [Solirubrobacterales bacterium]|nr:hypothetical protein [Solirubrobacterales bacterium]
MSRFRILALFATLAAVAGLLAACGGGSDDGDSSGEDPQKVLENASLEGVESGEIEMSLNVTAAGDEGGEVEVSLSGPFEAGAKGELPQLELSAEANGTVDDEDLDFEGGLTLLTDRGFVNYEGDAYEIDPTTFGFLKSALEQAQQSEGETGDITACQEAAEGIRFSQFADQLTNEGSVDVDGTSTTKVSGDLSISGGVDALIELTEDPACSSQLEAAGPLPLDELEEAKGELSKVIKQAHVDLYVGDDDIVRKVDAELTIAPPGAEDEKVELAMELTLSGVNEEQSFEAPSDAKPLEGLFKQLDVNPLELLEAGSEEGIGGLLEGILGGSVPGSSSGGSSSGGASSPDGAGANQKEYVECLQESESPADLQKCASLLE